MAKRLRVKFTDPEGVFYEIKISDPNYTSTFVREVQGTAVLEYPKVNTMDMLRGSVLKMQLEASVDIQYYSFLYNTVGDAQLGVELFRDNLIFWKGFIKPDGIVESFVNDYWIINVQAIDGLGYLENIKFKDANGDLYQGGVKELDLLARCLQITGQTFDFRLYDFDLYFTVLGKTAPTLSQRAIINTYSNTNRFFKEDDSSSVFTAKEVLESLLKKYGAYVTQQNGVWHIVRIASYFNESSTINYDSYNSDGTIIGSFVESKQIILGSQINGFYPHHASANQQKNYNVALTAYKVYYQYGFVKSIIANRKVRFNDELGNIDDWVITNGRESFFRYEFENDDPNFYPSGYYLGRMTSIIDQMWLALKTNPTIPNIVKSGSNLSIEIKNKTKWLYRIEQFVNIVLIGDDGIRYYLRADQDNNVAAWGEDIQAIRVFEYVTPNSSSVFKTENSVFTVESDICPVDGEIEVEFFLPRVFPTGGEFEYTIVQEVNITESVPENIKGESWTGIRGNNRPETRTAVVDTLNVFTGDNSNQAYIGGIEDVNGENTIGWSKKLPDGTIDISKQFPVLDWLTRDRLRISSGNSLLFTGGVYGYLPYLGVLTIDNIGFQTEPITPYYFMVVGYSYNLANNIISGQFERIFQADIYDDTIVYYNLEGQNIIRPAIEGV